MEKKRLFTRFLLIVLAYIFLGNLYAQQATTPPNVQSVQTWAGKTDAALYYAGAWYVGVNTPTGATIYRRNSNGTIDTLMDIPSKDAYPSGMHLWKSKNMIIVNNKLYFHAYVGGNENAILMYDLSTGASDFQKRLSFEGEDLQSLVSYNGNIYVTVSYASSIYRVAQGANWTNSIDTYAGSGNSETSIIKLDAAMNPSLVRHFNHASYNYGSIDNGTSLAGNGFLLNFNSGRFERINLDGTTTHSLYLGEDARMKLGMNGNYIIVKKKSAELRDANWSLLKTVGKISYDNLNNVTTSGNDYIFSVGLQNSLISYDDGKQEWAFYFYDADLNFKYKKSGVKLEYFFGIEPQVKNFQIFDLSSSGYRKLGFYYSVPHIGTLSGPLVQLAGEDLPAATNSNPISISYYRSMPVPTNQITIQLGSSGKDLYLNKKLVNGVITAADQFSALIVTQNTDLDALVGSQVPATIATFTAPAGWSIWKDPSSTLGEWGKLYIQKDANGDYFVNIPMYDSTADSYWVNAESGITNEVNKKIYLQNVTLSDADGDGIYDPDDLCPATPLGEVVDTNGCSQSQLDDDNDGVVNSLDQCPNTPTGETVDVNGCSTSQTDTDGDGIYDPDDLCPATPVGEVVDTNGCSQSQLDDDNDGVVNSLDTCPNTPTGETVDVNGCSQSQLDDDNDGVVNSLDQCPNTPTGETVDVNGCSTSQTDTDGDGVYDNQDNCPNIANPDQTDTDNDGIGDVCDNDNDNDGVPDSNDTCPNTPNGETVDANGCSSSQTDTDGDGIYDINDNCPTVSNANQLDTDNDGIGDVCDDDDDGDGVLDVNDNCPNTPLNEGADANGCSDSQNDFDGDGVPELFDQCPNTTAGETVDENGCALYQLDRDNDGFSDAVDQCINTPGTVNGCPDADTDGVSDDNDLCPNTAAGETVDENGCALYQLDTDTDGVSDDIDTCPNTPSGETVDVNGCSQSQLDDDNDGVVNSLDTCPNTPAGSNVDSNGGIIVSSNNFPIFTTGLTCTDKDNGEINIGNNSSYVFNVLIVSTNGYTSESSLGANGNIIITDLKPGTYNITFSFTEECGADITGIVAVVDDAESIVGAKVSTDAKSKTVTYRVANAFSYTVHVDGVYYDTFNFDDPFDHEIIIQLINAKSDVEISAGCRGSIEDIIIFNNIIIYPNPTARFVTVSGLLSSEVLISITSLSGRKIFQNTYSVQNSSVQFTLENVPVGMYIISVEGKYDNNNLKLVKK